MPCTDKRLASKPAKKRKMSKQKDTTRFYCPFPGCDRSCAELWRLKVHFRAPPDSKGSGVERGHNAELEFCPRCLQKLEAGKHHIGCRSGLAAPRQAMKREERNQEAKARDIATTIHARPRMPRKSGAAACTAAEDQGAVSEHRSSSSTLSAVVQPDSALADLSLVASAHTFSSLGGAIQLQRALNGHVGLLQPNSPGSSSLKCFSLGSPQLVPHFPDCEVDDEVVIPKSFAPLLSSGQGATSPTASFGSFGRGGLLARPYTCVMDQKPLQRPPNSVDSPWKRVNTAICLRSPP